MRLTCDVELVDRTLANLNMKKSGKPIRSQLSVGRNSVSDAVYIMLCTNKDKCGTKYRIKDNIDKVFTKFLSEGKATIRLKQPEKDICISKADIIHLKSFLNVLRMVLQGKELDKHALSSLLPASTKKIERPKTHLVITTKKNYPLTTNFPSSLTHLQIHECGMRRLDTRICQLRNLVTLDLSKNSLPQLPDEIANLHNLAELNLSSNKFELFPANITHKESIQKSLRLLDLCDNQIKQLPMQICELYNLTCLRMNNNGLEQVPATIGRLQSLKTVTLSGNRLAELPAGFLQLRMDDIDLFGNTFETIENQTFADHVDTPTLLECTARYIRKYRLEYNDELLHTHLCRYLDSARLCWCGSYCFQSAVRYTRMVDLRGMSACVTAVDSRGSTLVPVHGYLCSPQCLKKFKKDPNAYWK